MATALLDVLTWINTASDEDLTQVTQAIKMFQSLNAYKFKAGDPVKFDGGRNRGVMHGTFVKLMQKNASVRVNGVVWRVSPHLVQADPPAVVVAPVVPAQP